MGCCYCRPTTAVTLDPDVAMYAQVGTCVLIHPEGDYTMLSGLFDGLVHVRGSSLRYATTVGSIFWCECVGYNWGVSDIKQVESVNGNVTIRTGRGHRHLSMNPGLKIRFRDHDTLVMATPDAVSFCSRLREHIAGTRSGTGGEPDSELSASTQAMSSLDMYTPTASTFVTLTPTNDTVSYSKDAQEAL